MALATAMASGCTSPAPASVAPAHQGAMLREAKTLVLATGREIDNLGSFGAPDPEVSDMVHAGLVYRNAMTFQEEPWLARELPSWEKGTWLVNPDGTMVTTYRLRPNIRWHDGTPFTAQDLAFGRELMVDPQIPIRSRRFESGGENSRTWNIHLRDWD